MKKTIIIIFWIINTVLSGFSCYGNNFPESEIIDPTKIYIPEGTAFAFSNEIPSNAKIVVKENTEAEANTIYILPNTKVYISEDLVTNAIFINLKKEISPNSDLAFHKIKKQKTVLPIKKEIQDNASKASSFPFSKNSNQNKILSFTSATLGMNSQRSKANIAGNVILIKISWSKSPVENVRQKTKNGQASLKMCLQEIDGLEAFCRPPPQFYSVYFSQQL